MARPWDALLRSDNLDERLRGVELLAEGGSTLDADYLAGLRRSEENSWVQRAMDQLLRNWRGQEPQTDGLPNLEIAPEVVEAKAGEIQSLAKTFVHEVSHLCGRIELRAMSEIGADVYAGSKTRQAMQRLQEFLDVIRELHEAAEPTSFHEFNLTDCVLRAAAFCDPDADDVVYTRDDSVTVVGDERHLRIALVNIIRNALYESRLKGGTVTIAWDNTDHGYWVSVMDQGNGLPPGFSKMFEPNVTTKSTERHFGWGLTIARQALEVLGAKIRFTPGATGGTVCYVSFESSESID